MKNIKILVLKLLGKIKMCKKSAALQYSLIEETLEERAKRLEAYETPEW